MVVVGEPGDGADRVSASSDDGLRHAVLDVDHGPDHFLYRGLPVFTVTVYGALTNIYRSGIRWTMPAKLLMLSMFGWAAGIVPAIVDGTISVNKLMHNTQWVPGHFHFYLLLGVLPMVLALLYHMIGQRTPAGAGHKLSFPLYVSAG